MGELDFQDVDVLGAGPIGRHAVASFEAYWNSPFAVPISKLGKFAPDPAFFPTARARLRDRCDALSESPYSRSLVESELVFTIRIGLVVSGMWKAYQNINSDKVRFACQNVPSPLRKTGARPRADVVAIRRYPFTGAPFQALN